MPSNVVVPGDILLGRGEVYIDRLDASGVKTGERFIGNCTTFEIKNEDETRDKYSSAEATAPLIKSVNTRRTPGISIVLNEINKENLALAFMGDNSTYTQSGATVTDEAVPTTSIKKGYWFQLGGAAPIRDIVATPVIRSASGGGGTLYVLGTDYLVDQKRARVFVITAGAIPDAGPLFVTYTKNAIAGTALPTVRGGVSNFIEAFVRFVGTPATGPTWEVEVWKASLSPDGAVGFIADDYAEFTMNGKVLADTVGHPTEPFFRAYKVA
jgi:hypothetical protein